MQHMLSSHHSRHRRRSCPQTWCWRPTGQVLRSGCDLKKVKVTLLSKRAEDSFVFRGT